MAALFPACAGMNRPLTTAEVEFAAVPRMRGDEPVAPMSAIDGTVCSPHARG